MFGEDARGRTPDGYLGRMPYSINVHTTPYLPRGTVLKSNVPGMPGVFMHPLTFMDALSADGQHDKAPVVLAEQYVATVDRRLRAAGMYPRRPDQCSHPAGLDRDVPCLMYRCDRCGFGVTDESLARWER